jgi:hypothetical protein
LHFKRANIDAAVAHPPKNRTALIVQRRRSKVRVTCINGRATRQEFMGKGWAAVILKRAKHWVGIDLIARAS